MAGTGEPTPPRHMRREFVGAVLMALITVTTTWCAYQSSMWSSRQTFLLADADVANRLALEKQLEGNQQGIMDRWLIGELIRAARSGDEELAAIFLRGLRPNLRPTVEAWLAMRPFEPGSTAPPHPFLSDPLVAAEHREARALYARSSELTTRAKHASRNFTSYNRLHVLLAVGLLCAGVSATLTGARRRVVLGAGLLVFMGCVAWVLMLERAFGPP